MWLHEQFNIYDHWTYMSCTRMYAEMHLQVLPPRILRSGTCKYRHIHCQARVIMLGITIMKRLNQVISILNQRSWDLHVLAGNRTWAVGGEHYSKELLEQRIDSYLVHLHTSLRQSKYLQLFRALYKADLQYLSYDRDFYREDSSFSLYFDLIKSKSCLGLMTIQRYHPAILDLYASETIG